MTIKDVIVCALFCIAVVYIDMAMSGTLTFAEDGVVRTHQFGIVIERGFFMTVALVFCFLYLQVAKQPRQ